MRKKRKATGSYIRHLGPPRPCLRCRADVWNDPTTDYRMCQPCRNEAGGGIQPRVDTGQRVTGG